MSATVGAARCGRALTAFFCRCGGKGSAGGLFGSQQLPFPCGEANFFSGLRAGEASCWGGGLSLPSAALDIPFSGKGGRTDAACRGDGGRAAGGFLAPSFGGETRNKRLSPAQETLFAGAGVGRAVPLWGRGRPPLWESGPVAGGATWRGFSLSGGPPAWRGRADRQGVGLARAARASRWGRVLPAGGVGPAAANGAGPTSGSGGGSPLPGPRSPPVPATRAAGADG